MFERKIEFYVTDQEMEKALPRLVQARIDFSVRHLDSQKKECWAVQGAFLQKDILARILYANG